MAFNYGSLVVDPSQALQAGLGAYSTISNIQMQKQQMEMQRQQQEQQMQMQQQKIDLMNQKQKSQIEMQDKLKSISGALSNPNITEDEKTSLMAQLYTIKPEAAAGISKMLEQKTGLKKLDQSRLGYSILQAGSEEEKNAIIDNKINELKDSGASSESIAKIEQLRQVPLSDLKITSRLAVMQGMNQDQLSKFASNEITNVTPAMGGFVGLRQQAGKEPEMVFMETNHKTKDQIDAELKQENQTFDKEAKLRKEWEARNKDFIQVRDSYNRIQSNDAKTAAGQIGLVFNFMKMLDPGSVVRESEFATAQNAAGVPERIRNMYNKLLAGEFLTEEQIADFKRTTEQMYQSQLKGREAAKEEYRPLIKKYGLDQKVVFGDDEDKKQGNITSESVKNMTTEQLLGL